MQQVQRPSDRMSIRSEPLASVDLFTQSRISTEVNQRVDCVAGDNCPLSIRCGPRDHVHGFVVRSWTEANAENISFLRPQYRLPRHRSHLVYVLTGTHLFVPGCLASDCDNTFS